jgi:hypothetical protein
MAPKMATMDDENLALCKFYRQPPDGSKPLAYSKIAAKVKRRDGHRPSAAGVCLAACSLGVVVHEEHSGASALAVVCSLLCVYESVCMCVFVCSVGLARRVHGTRFKIKSVGARRILFQNLDLAVGYRLRWRAPSAGTRRRRWGGRRVGVRRRRTKTSARLSSGSSFVVRLAVAVVVVVVVVCWSRTRALLDRGP